VHCDGAPPILDRIMFDRISGHSKSVRALDTRVAKIHHATFRKCDAFNGNSLLRALQKIDCAPVACRESGTYVPPEIGHVASPSIDGFGAPFTHGLSSWMVFANHAICAVNTLC
jgi:hypothetical protein